MFGGILPLFALLAIPSPGPAIEYRNVDSLVVGNLVFFGAREAPRCRNRPGRR